MNKEDAWACYLEGVYYMWDSMVDTMNVGHVSTKQTLVKFEEKTRKEFDAWWETEGERKLANDSR